MLYTLNNKFGLTFDELRLSFPGTSFAYGQAVFDEELGISTYEPTEQPEFDKLTEFAYEVAPVDGKQQWQVFPLPLDVVERNKAEEIKQKRQAAKDKRQVDVENIVVSIANGKSFDGDELAQTRMARAIVAMQASSTATTQWILADNSIVEVTLEELTEALILAGQEQTRIWVNFEEQV
jgi:hypothetical protein